MTVADMSCREQSNHGGACLTARDHAARTIFDDNAFARRYPDFGRRMQENVQVRPSRNVQSAEDAAFEQLRHLQNLKRDSEPLWRRGRCDAAGQSDEFCDELPHARNWCKIFA